MADTLPQGVAEDKGVPRSRATSDPSRRPFEPNRSRLGSSRGDVGQNGNVPASPGPPGSRVAAGVNQQVQGEERGYRVRLHDNVPDQTGDRARHRGRDPRAAMNPFRGWRDPLCRAGCAAYLINRFCLKPVLPLPFLHSHFNDLLLIPCALPILLSVHERLGLRPRGGVPTWPEFLGHWALWSVLFEWVGPRLFVHATGDPLDVVAYGVGGLVSMLWWRRPVRWSRFPLARAGSASHTRTPVS